MSQIRQNPSFVSESASLLVDLICVPLNFKSSEEPSGQVSETVTISLSFAQTRQYSSIAASRVANVWPTPEILNILLERVCIVQTGIGLESVCGASSAFVEDTGVLSKADAQSTLALALAPCFLLATDLGFVLLRLLSAPFSFPEGRFDAACARALLDFGFSDEARADGLPARRAVVIFFPAAEREPTFASDFFTFLSPSSSPRNIDALAIHTP